MRNYPSRLDGIRISVELGRNLSLLKKHLFFCMSIRVVPRYIFLDHIKEVVDDRNNGVILTFPPKLTSSSISPVRFRTKSNVGTTCLP